MIDSDADDAPQPDLPLPDYAIHWQIPGLQHFRGRLPAHLDNRVALGALFYIPPSEEGSSTSSGQYITRHPCSLCRVKRKVWCDRSYPTCSMCKKFGGHCVPFKTEWMLVPPKQGPGSRGGKKKQHTAIPRRDGPRKSYQRFPNPALPTDDAPEPAVSVKAPQKPQCSEASNVKGQDQTCFAVTLESASPPLGSSKDPPPPPGSDVTPSILTPTSPPLPLVAVEPTGFEAPDNGGPLIVVDHDAANDSVHEEPFRWKPLSTPWTSMYRDHQSRSFFEPLPSTSGANLTAAVEERTSQTVAWSDTLEELREAIPFLHNLEPGYQLSSAGLLEALVLAGPAKPDDKCVDDVIWFTLAFRSELNKSKTPIAREPTLSDYPIDPIIDALHLNHRWGVPFALIADEQFGVLPFSLGAPYTVLGWYHVCGVGKSTHTFDPTLKRPSLESSWTFRFRPAQSKPEPGESSSVTVGAADASMLGSLGSNGRNDGEPTLNWAPLCDQQAEDIVMEAASTGDMLVDQQTLEASSVPMALDPSLADPLVESVPAVRISQNIQSEPYYTAAMEVDPPCEALQPSDDIIARGGQVDITDPSAEIHPHQQLIEKDKQPEHLEGNLLLPLGAYKQSHPLPSQAEMFAEFAYALMKIDGRGQERPASASASSPQSSRIARTSQDTGQMQTKNQQAVNSSQIVDTMTPDRSVSSVPQPQSSVRPNPPVEPASGPLQSRSSRSEELGSLQKIQRGSINSRLMANVADRATLRKPTREEFAFKGPAVDTSVSSATLEEQPREIQGTETGVQTSLSGAGDVDGEPLVTAEEAVSGPLLPQPPPNTEDLVTAATTPPPAEPSDPIPNASSSKKSQLKVVGSTRKDKYRLKNARPILRPAQPQDLPQFPHLAHPPSADSPISPEELGLLFERRKLDADSTTQWDIIATKLDGFVCARCRKANARRFWSSLRCNYCQHRVELPRPKWTWHSLTLRDSAVMPKDGREDADYYKDFTMDRVLWDDGVETVTYVGKDDARLKIIHVRTTRSALRDPLENLIAESAELDFIRPRFAHGTSAGTLAPYFAHLVGEGAVEVHPELKPVSFEEAHDKDSIIENIDQFMGQCAAHSCLSAEAEPFDQQLLLLGGADAPAITEEFCKDNRIAFTVVGATCDLTVKSVNTWKGDKGREEHDFFSHIDVLHGDFVCVISPAPLKYSLERKGFGLVVLGRWLDAKAVEGD